MEVSRRPASYSHGDGGPLGGGPGVGGGGGGTAGVAVSYDGLGGEGGGGSSSFRRSRGSSRSPVKRNTSRSKSRGPAAGGGGHSSESGHRGRRGSSSPPAHGSREVRRKVVVTGSHGTAGVQLEVEEEWVGGRRVGRAGKRAGGSREEEEWGAGAFLQVSSSKGPVRQASSVSPESAHA